MTTTKKEVFYEKHSFLEGEFECSTCCRFLGDDMEPGAYNWICKKYDVYLGKYRAKRCEECVKEFGVENA